MKWTGTVPAHFTGSIQAAKNYSFTLQLFPISTFHGIPPNSKISNN